MARVEVNGARLTSFTEELVVALRKKRREPNCWVRALVSLVGLAVTLFEAATDETSRRRNKRWGQNEIIGIIFREKAKSFHSGGRTESASVGEMDRG